MTIGVVSSCTSRRGVVPDQGDRFGERSLRRLRPRLAGRWRPGRPGRAGPGCGGRWKRRHRLGRPAAPARYDAGAAAARPAVRPRQESGAGSGVGGWSDRAFRSHRPLKLCTRPGRVTFKRLRSGPGHGAGPAGGSPAPANGDTRCELDYQAWASSTRRSCSGGPLPARWVTWPVVLARASAGSIPVGGSSRRRM